MLLVVFTTRITFVCVPLNFIITIIFRLNDTALRDVMYKNPELVFKGKAVNGVLTDREVFQYVNACNYITNCLRVGTINGKL